MKHGPFVFLGLFFALALSWFGMIVTPQLQIGSEQPTNVPPASILYPTAYPGLAAQGQEVYRANGCAFCHTRVVRQEGVRLDVVITKPGTNQAAVVQALLKLKTGLSTSEAEKLVASTPVTVLTGVDKTTGDAAQKALSDEGAESAVRVIPLGPDIERGWGIRQSVGRDYLYDRPVMFGVLRLGPDLTNVGLRRDKVWQLIHLFDPRLETPGSIMPRYPFLFEKRARLGRPSSEALPIPGAEDIIPRQEAYALVAYLTSMKADLPLFEAPGPLAPAPATSAGDTNQPAATNRVISIPNAVPATGQSPAQGAEAK